MATAAIGGLYLRNSNENDKSDDKGDLIHVEVEGAVMSDSGKRTLMAEAIGSKLNNLF
ncbi:MAG: hypothetical protein M3357_07360 [Actinomycetota bacterium]|nr:hypothetical protein [Actinomycetota bacterium]